MEEDIAETNRSDPRGVIQGKPMAHSVNGEGASSPAGMKAPPPELAATLQGLCDEALFLRAHALTLPHGPLDGWTDTRARLAAARLASHTGAPRLASKLALLAYRRAPTDPEAILYWAYRLLEGRGPYETWRRLAPVTLPPGTDPDLVSRLTRLRADCAIALRDFDRAHALLDRAEKEHARDAWILADRSLCFEREDRYDEALATAEEALGLFPTNRMAILQTAKMLAIHDRRGDAIDLLAERGAPLESAAVCMFHASLLGEEQRHAEQLAALDRAERFSPLLEAEGAAQIASMRADGAYHLGRIDEAIAEARKAGTLFFTRIADRLAAGQPGKRVILDVGFVRQHHLTCVPATLATLSRYWGKEARHLEIAEAICYDGTPAHSERRWAEENGWVTRELTVTWDSARALIDRGVPFTLATVEAASAHMQAVIGYDERRGTLTLRDPFIPMVREAVADLFLENYRAHGPRGMALVPREKADALEGLDLPDEALHDRLHRIERALAAHDRGAAARALDELSGEAPDHPITWRARRALGAYDADPARVQESGEALLARFPTDGNCELTVLSCMSHTAGRAERIARLEAWIARGPSHPVFLQRLATELAADARDHARAAIFSRRLLRMGVEQAEPFGQLASLCWSEKRFDEAIELLRFGATVEPHNEGAILSYFTAARLRDRPSEALPLLEARNARLGARSAAPVASLFEALDDLGRTVEAFTMLDAALIRRPEDGELLLFAARARARFGFADQARELLARAEGRVRRPAFLRGAAEIAERLDTPAEALPLWRAVLDHEPLAEDAHAKVTALLGMVEDEAAARAHLEAACARFPHHRALLRFAVDYLSDHDPAAAERAVRRFLALEPASAWGHRALAALCFQAGQLDEAAASIAEAAKIAPKDIAQLLLTARLARRRGQGAEARAAYREVIHVAPDVPEAIGGLVGASEQAGEAAAALDFIEAEVAARATDLGLVAWLQVARARRSPDALIDTLAKVRSARPRLDAAWTLGAQLLGERGRLDEALALAEEAAERFPLKAQTWSILARTRRLRGETAKEVEALERALVQEPTFTTAVLRLSEIHAAAGALSSASSIVDRTLARAPLDASLLLRKADLAWKAGEREASLAVLRKVLTIDVHCDPAWNSFHQRSTELGRPGDAAALAREAAARRPRDAGLRLLVARILATRGASEGELAGAFDDALAAVDEALAIDPRLVEAHDLRADLLSDLGRHDEALAACAPPAFGGEIPLVLRGRAAFLRAAGGDTAGSMQALKALVTEQPDYLWALLKLAELAQAEGAHEQQLAAADQIVELAPSNPIGHGFRGDAHRKLGNRKDAKHALSHALTIAPAYAFAGFALLDMMLNDNELDGAAATLARVAPHHEPSALASFRIRLALARDDRAAADLLFCALCRDPSTPDADLRDAADALGRGGLYQLEGLLRALLDEPVLHPETGVLWVRTRAATHRHPDPDLVRTLFLRDDELGARATRAAFEVLGEFRTTLATLGLMRRLFLRREAPTSVWAAAGYALVSSGAHLFAVLWMRSYRRREGVKPWMLNNLAIALRARFLGRRALAVSRYALTLPADHATPHHRIWLAFDDAVHGRPEAASARLGGIAPARLGASEKAVFTFTTAMIDLSRTPARERPNAMWAARGRLNAALPDRNYFLADRPVERAYRAAARRLALDARSLSALIWAYGRTLIGLGVVLFFSALDVTTGAVIALVWATIVLFFRGLDRL
ncbi:MAG: C39 family peptidase [Byssovorax sp.]